MDRSTYGLSVLLLTQLTGVHPDTARRWKRTGKFPRHLQRLFDLVLHQDLGALDDAWTGFRLAGGYIWTPEGDRFRPGDLRAIPYRAHQIQALERELREERKPPKLVQRCRTATRPFTSQRARVTAGNQETV